MKITDNQYTNYIFFHQTQKELPAFFGQLVHYFKKMDIELLPIETEELTEVSRVMKVHLISLRSNLQSAEKLTALRPRFLDKAILNGKANLYDLSSFSELEFITKEDSPRQYFHFPMPLEIKEIAIKIGIEYYKSKENSLSWPGGRRARLPEINQ